MNPRPVSDGLTDRSTSHHSDEDPHPRSKHDQMFRETNIHNNFTAASCKAFQLNDVTATSAVRQNSLTDVNGMKTAAVPRPTANATRRTSLPRQRTGVPSEDGSGPRTVDALPSHYAVAVPS